MVHKKRVDVHRDACDISSSAGYLLSYQTDVCVGMIERLTDCFTDCRRPGQIRHPLNVMLAQRIYGLIEGYEDLNDHDDLRHDVFLAHSAGADPASIGGKNQLSSSKTLNRLEHGTLEDCRRSRYWRFGADTDKVDHLQMSLFVEGAKRRKGGERDKQGRRVFVVDMDSTDDPIHGEQEGRFFNGFHKKYCYLPLHMFIGKDAVCNRLLPGNVDPAEHCIPELERIVSRIRESFPKARIIIRGDSGFCRDYLMAWCEARRVDFLFGLPGNRRLRRAITAERWRARSRYRKTGKAERVFADFRWSTLGTWARQRRVVAKAEHLPDKDKPRFGKSNPRFVVTSLGRRYAGARALYEKIYCARGDMENRIKETQLDLFSDRTSTRTLRANQLRLYFSAFAYTLLLHERRLGFSGTRSENAQCGTHRLRFHRIAVRLVMTARKVRVYLPKSFARSRDFIRALKRIGRHPPWLPAT